ncbi:UNVERIFIED_CONTAM: hypothetical protein RMT77_003042 [Armadillidium vulgare]
MFKIMPLKVRLALAITVFVFCVVTGEVDKNDSTKSEPSLPTSDDKARQEKLIALALYSSTTVIRLTTVTKAVLTTCYSITPMSVVACNGRRRKRGIVSADEFPDINSQKSGDLEASLSNKAAVEDQDTREKSGRKLTFWSTDYSTLTVTTKSFIQGTTVTVTAKCTINGVLSENTCGFVHFD